MIFGTTVRPVWVCAVLLAAMPFAAVGQIPQVPPAPAGTVAPPQGISLRPDYMLGPNDQVLVRVPQEEQINDQPFRVDEEGYVNLPVAGRVRAEGLTVQALEAAIAAKLREFILNPTVSITVVQFRSDPVFLVGAFRAPGIYTLQGRRTLLEMLASTGGTLPNASRRVRVTRRAEFGPIPLPNAVEDMDKKTTSVEISLQSLWESINSPEDLILQGYDVITVERAERVYVTGEVVRPLPIELGERDSISVAQAITESGGLTQFAKKDKVRILRPVLGTSRRAQIEVDLQRIFEGKDNDYPLLPNDVLFVAKAEGKAFLVPVAGSMIASLPFVIISLASR